MATQFRVIILRKEIHHVCAVSPSLALTSSNHRTRWTARCSQSNALLQTKAMTSSVSRKAALNAIHTTVMWVQQAQIFRILTGLHFSRSLKLDLPEVPST